jgi:hypothetical protein
LRTVAISALDAVASRASMLMVADFRSPRCIA